MTVYYRSVNFLCCCISVDSERRRIHLSITGRLLKSLFVFILSSCFLIHHLELDLREAKRAHREIPERIPAPAQRPVSPSCWSLQVRRRTQCSEYQTAGWVGGWNAPDAYTHTHKHTQFNKIQVFMSGDWCDVMTHFFYLDSHSNRWHVTYNPVVS